MTIGNDFDFVKYDRGGQGAVAGDGKLTGAEVAAARRDGYNIFEGYTRVESRWKKPEKQNKNIFDEIKQQKLPSKEFDNNINLKTKKNGKFFDKFADSGLFQIFSPSSNINEEKDV